MWFCKVTSCGSINHQGCSIAFVIRAAKSCYPCRSVLQTWFCFCNIICCIATSSKIFTTYWPYINNSLLPYITYKAAIRFLSSLHQLLYFLLLSIFEGGTAFYCSPIFYQWSRGVWFWTPIIEFCFCPFCPFPFWGMTCKFLLPFFVVFPFTATFCSCSLFRYFIQIACLFFSVGIFVDLVFYLQFIHKFTTRLFRLTSINSENRFFATICPSGRKFRRILLVYNLLKTR